MRHTRAALAAQSAYWGALQSEIEVDVVHILADMHRSGVVAPPPPVGSSSNTCRVAGCQKKPHLYRLCKSHGGSRPCPVEGCVRKVYARGVCQRHSALAHMFR